ncbi:tripartite tricarboxylate transporter substrate binding protein [Bacillaceae bacterium W0354]
MFKFRNWVIIGLIVSLLALAACGDDKASDDKDGSDWPHKTTTFVLPFDAGGSLDTMIRGMIPHLEKELDTKFTVDNRPGAATQIGTTVFHNSKDDGSYLFAGTQLYFSATMVLQDAEYDIDDFAMVNVEQFDPITITVPKDSQFETFADLIEYAKANPGELSYSTVFGGPLHLTGVLLEDKLGIELKPVFYDGGGEMRNALLGDHVDFMIGNSNGDTAIADNVRVLATATDEVSELWPDAEPINVALEPYGVKVPHVGSVRFIAVHQSFKENHPERFDALVKAYENMFNSEEYQKHLEDTGAIVVSKFRGPEESDRMNKELHDLIVEYQDELKAE